MFCQSLGPSLNRGSTSQSPTAHFPNKNNGCLFASLIFLSLPLFTYFTLNNTFYLLCAFCLFHISPFSTHLSYTSFSVWVMHKSIPDAPSPPPPFPPGLLQGIALARLLLFSPGGGAFASFALPGAFDTNAVSYQNITTQRIFILEKKHVGSSVKDRVL